MLVVTIDLLPQGDESKKETIGKMFIINDGTGDVATGNYQVSLMRRGENKIWKQGNVRGFPRITLGAYDLLYRALRVLLQNRNK